MDQKARTAITAFLAAHEPATLEQICWELKTQLGLKTTDVMPIAITEIAALQEKGLICQHDPDPDEHFDSPLDFAWVLTELTEQKPNPKPKYHLNSSIIGTSILQLRSQLLDQQASD